MISSSFEKEIQELKLVLKWNLEQSCYDFNEVFWTRVLGRNSFSVLFSQNIITCTIKNYLWNKKSTINNFLVLKPLQKLCYTRHYIGTSTSGWRTSCNFFGRSVHLEVSYLKALQYFKMNFAGYLTQQSRFGCITLFGFDYNRSAAYEPQASRTLQTVLIFHKFVGTWVISVSQPFGKWD